MATFLLGLAAIALAWATFRIERYGARQREITSASALLMAVKSALVTDSFGEEFHPGWGEIYFATNYTPAKLKEVGERVQRHAEMGNFDQVFVVPTEPLEKLATTEAAGDLISADTVAAANVALWRVHVFNQLVYQQTTFNAVRHVELRDPTTTEGRKRAIAESARKISEHLHHYGVDGAGAPDGWYQRLKDAIEADIERLYYLARPGWRRWFTGDPFAVFDVLVAVTFVTAIVVALW